jgi:hypothetical protein
LSILFVGELLGYLTSAGFDGPSDTFGDLDKMLALYVKQGYLHRFKETMEDEPTHQWGPRSKAEISYKDLAKFMSSVSNFFEGKGGICIDCQFSYRYVSPITRMNSKTPSSNLLDFSDLLVLFACYQ